MEIVFIILYLIIISILELFLASIIVMGCIALFSSLLSKTNIKRKSEIETIVMWVLWIAVLLAIVLQGINTFEKKRILRQEKTQRELFVRDSLYRDSLRIDSLRRDPLYIDSVKRAKEEYRREMEAFHDSILNNTLYIIIKGDRVYHSNMNCLEAKDIPFMKIISERETQEKGYKLCKVCEEKDNICNDYEEGELRYSWDDEEDY